MLRYLTGAVLVGLVYLLLSRLFPGEGSRLFTPFRFLRYALAGLTASLGAPWLFIRLRLTPAR